MGQELLDMYNYVRRAICTNIILKKKNHIMSILDETVIIIIIIGIETLMIAVLHSFILLF